MLSAGKLGITFALRITSAEGVPDTNLRQGAKDTGNQVLLRLTSGNPLKTNPSNQTYPSNQKVSCKQENSESLRMTLNISKRIYR